MFGQSIQPTRRLPVWKKIPQKNITTNKSILVNKIILFFSSLGDQTIVPKIMTYGEGARQKPPHPFLS
jgi:predicted DNA repair protein MutK